MKLKTVLRMVINKENLTEKARQQHIVRLAYNKVVSIYPYAHHNKIFIVQ